MINQFLLQNKASAGDVASDMQKTANDRRKLQQMINYCETDKCLMEFILSYFGDTTPCICNKCSNCVVVEDEEEETYVETGKKRKKAAQSVAAPRAIIYEPNWPLALIQKAQPATKNIAVNVNQCACKCHTRRSGCATVGR